MVEEKRKQKWIIIISCIVVSFCLWLYISSVNNIIKTVKITVPVTILNTESVSQYKLAVLSDKKYTVSITVKGVLPYIDEVKADNFKIIADLGDYAVKKGENKIPLSIKEIPQNVNIINKDTLWVTIYMDDLEEKSVPVKVNIVGNVKDGYSALDTVVTPKEVNISGAAKYVDSISSVYTNIDLKDSEKDINMTLPLQASSESDTAISNIKIQPSVVSVLTPVRKTKLVSVNVTTKGNIDKNLNMKSIIAVPDKVKIAGTDSVIDSITKLDTEPVDLSTISDSGTLNTKIILPDGVKLLNNSDTVQVKVTLENVIQKNYSMDIQTKNLSDAYNVTLNNTKESFIVSGTQSTIEGIKNEDISCYVDLNSLGEGDYDVPITIILPDGVNKLSQSPSTVKVSIKKKDSVSPSVTQ
ncbi:MAG: CdaR family protein [Bacillota bacterium]|nr:CdaR family protein [Bacillota bacterium]